MEIKAKKGMQRPKISPEWEGDMTGTGIPIWFAKSITLIKKTRTGTLPQQRLFYVPIGKNSPVYAPLF